MMSQILLKALDRAAMSYIRYEYIYWFCGQILAIYFCDANTELVC